MAAAPPFVVFERWAPGTLTLCSFVTANSRGSVLHRIRTESAASLLRSGILSLHHHQLLSTPALARQRVKSGLVSPRAGAGAAALSFCSDRICGDARARTPASDRTGAGESIIGDAGHQAGVRATCAGGLAPSRSFRSNSPWGAGRWNGGASGSLASMISSCSRTKSERRSCAICIASR